MIDTYLKCPNVNHQCWWSMSSHWNSWCVVRSAMPQKNLVTCNMFFYIICFKIFKWDVHGFSQYHGFLERIHHIYIYIWVVITVSCFVQLIPDKSSPADVASATTLLHSPDRSSAPWHHFTTQFFAVNNSQDLWPISMRFPRFKHQVVRHQNRWIKGFDFNICWWFLSPIKSAYFKKMTLTFRQRLRRRLVAPLTPHLPPSVASSPWLWKGCRRRRSVDRTPCQWDWRSSLAENYPLAIEHC